MIDKLIKLITEENFNNEFRSFVSDLICEKIKETECSEIEAEDGDVTHFDCETTIGNYIITWNACSSWRMSKNTAKYDEQDNGRWMLYHISFNDITICNDDLETIFFSEELQSEFDKINKIL